MKQNIVTKSASILAIIFFFVSCGEENAANIVVKMFDDGIELVQKAESAEDVQKIYDNVIAKVEEYKSEHLKEIAAIDSVAPLINEAQHIFTKACCIKAFSFNDSYIKNEKGVTIAINSTGEVVSLEDLQGNDGLTSKNYEESRSIQNPLGITKIVPVFKPAVEKDFSELYEMYKGKWEFNYLTLQNSDGTIKYSDEDAENYYNLYAQLFFMAIHICGYYHDYVDSEIKTYLENHLTEILQELPLDGSYPKNIREYVNRVYYNDKDEMKTTSVNERGYGYIRYTYYNRWQGDRYFRVLRGNNGALEICGGY